MPSSGCDLEKTHLLQLLILQITPHHHFQHNEELPIAYVPVAIDIVDLEGEVQFFFFVALGTECAEARDKFLEVNIATTIFVEYCDHTGEEEKEN